MDVLVVGASFAGLACARAASILGLDVTVIDRKPEPGAAPHTTGILVQEAARAVELPRSLMRRIDGVRLYSPSLRSVDLESPGYSFYATDLPGIMRWMADQTEAVGVRLEMGSRFEGATRIGNRFSVNGTSATPRFLVGADGARSAVARSFGLGRNTTFLFGLEAEVAGVEGIDRDRLHVFIDRRLAPGYIGWAVPGVHSTQIGLACRRGVKPDLPAMLAQAGRVFDLSGARVLAHRAGVIPVGGAVTPIGTEGVLLVGDAAGLVSPLTAGGIHNALHFGRLSGRAIAEHLLDDGPAPFEAMGDLVPGHGWKIAMRRLWDHAPPNRVIDALGFSRPALAMARLVFFHNRGLLSVDGWRALGEAAVRRAG